MPFASSAASSAAEKFYYKIEYCPGKQKIVPFQRRAHTYHKMQPEDDGELLRRYAGNQSNEAFATLVARHINLVYSVALRSTADPHHAEEITQAVFIILAKKAPQLRHDKALSSWLFQATRLTVNNFLRSEIRRLRREQEAHTQLILDESGGGDVWPQIAPLLDNAVGALNDKDCRAILLRFYQSRSLREVGAALGGNEESAKKRVARALEKLRRYFSKRGVQSTTAMIAGAISENSAHAAPASLAVSVMATTMAKGTAASGSTLALVKGALKIMAWTKTKKAAVAAGVTLIIAGLGILAFNSFDSWHSSPDIQGAWEGSILLEDPGIGAGQAARTRVVLTLVKTNGSYSATANWIELGKRNVAMGKVTYNYPYLHIGGNPTWWIWDLRINADGTQMTLDQATRSIAQVPALFLRTSSPDAVPAPLAEEEFAPGGGSGFQGYWEGELDINADDYFFYDQLEPGTDAMPINLKISEQGNGKFRAEVDCPEWGAEGPATGKYHGSLVKFSDDVGGGLFQGAMNDDGTELIGSWTTGGRSVPAKFKRADYRAKRSQDGEKDYSPASPDDLQGHWKGSWVMTTAKTKPKPALHLALDIAKLPDGSYSASLTYLDLFANNDPIATDLKYNSPHIRLKWKWWERTFVGTLKNGELVGVLTLKGPKWTRTYPLTFERSGPY
jgi:RNA polymerase sigma factor (sigma-70 family)